VTGFIGGSLGGILLNGLWQRWQVRRPDQAADAAQSLTASLSLLPQPAVSHLSTRQTRITDADLRALTSTGVTVAAAVTPYSSAPPRSR
jgi:hypothetical protein